MSIIKDYEGSEIIEGSVLATKPDDQEKTLEALMKFTEECDAHLEQVELVLMSDQTPYDILTQFQDCTQSVVQYLHEDIPALHPETFDLYCQRIQNADYDTLDMASMALSFFVQKMYEDGVKHIQLSGHKYPVLNATLLFGLSGTQERPLKLTMESDRVEALLVYHHCEISVVGSDPAVAYSDEKNIFLGRHQDLDILKKVARETEGQDNLYMVDPSGKATIARE